MRRIGTKPSSPEPLALRGSAEPTAMSRVVLVASIRVVVPARLVLPRKLVCRVGVVRAASSAHCTISSLLLSSHADCDVALLRRPGWGETIWRYMKRRIFRIRLRSIAKGAHAEERRVHGRFMRLSTIIWSLDAGLIHLPFGRAARFRQDH